MDVRVTWAAANKRVDGKAMPIEQIKAQRLEISADGGQNFGTLKVLAANVAEYIQTELEAGTWFFRMFTVDQFDQESAPAVGSITLLPAKPNAPSNFTVALA